jgi:predicted Rossmann-fold nucleotide-binding protein
LDELAEILTWKQLGLVHASVGLLNTQGYFNPLVQQMKLMVTEGFLQAKNLDELKISNSPRELLNQLGVITG